MPFLVLGNEKFRFAQGTFQPREKVAKRLLIVPHMRAGTMAGTAGIFAAFPCPEAPVLLAEHSGGFQHGKRIGYGFQQFVRQITVKKRVGEGQGIAAQLPIAGRPIGGCVVDAAETACIPWLIVQVSRGEHGFRDPGMKAGVGHIPVQPQRNASAFAGSKVQRNRQRGAGRKAGVVILIFAVDQAAVGNVPPDQRQCVVAPAAAHPAGVHTGGKVHLRGKSRFIG